MPSLRQSGNRSSATRVSLGTALCAALLSTSTGAYAAPDDYVLIQGYTISEETMFGDGVKSWKFGPEEKEALITAACKSRSEEDFEEILNAFYRRDAALKDIIKESENIGPYDYASRDEINLAGAHAKIEKEKNIESGKEFVDNIMKLNKKCKGNPTLPISSFTIIYNSCAMYMHQNGQQLLITLPPSTNGAVMYLRAPDDKKPKVLNLNHRFEQAQNSVGRDTAMTNASLDLSPSGERGTHLGLATRVYDTRFGANSGAGMIASAGMPKALNMGTISVSSYGQVAIAADAPGLDVIRNFHRNFEREVRVPGAVDAFLNGLVEQMARITELGMPMDQEQTISSGVMTPMGRIGQAGYSRQVITGIAILPAAKAPPIVAGICNRTLINEGETSEDLGQLMAGAGAADPGATGQARSEMQRAMQEAAKALEGMDPAARKMMEQMGIKIPGVPKGD